MVVSSVWCKLIINRTRILTKGDHPLHCAWMSYLSGRRFSPSLFSARMFDKRGSSVKRAKCLWLNVFRFVFFFVSSLACFEGKTAGRSHLGGDVRVPKVNELILGDGGGAMFGAIRLGSGIDFVGSLKCFFFFFNLRKLKLCFK